MPAAWQAAAVHNRTIKAMDCVVFTEGFLGKTCFDKSIGNEFNTENTEKSKEPHDEHR